VKTLTKSQQAIVDAIVDANNNGHELSNIGKGYNKMSLKSAEKLIELGIIKIESRSRLRTDDMEMVYWRVYVLVNPVMDELK
jgi:hypothetical protein